MVLCSRCRRSNMRTDPSAPTEANISLPPPARLNAMSYTCTYAQRQWSKCSFKLCVQPHRASSYSADTHTSLSWAISWVFTCPDTRLTRPNTWPVSNPQMVQVVSMLEVPADRTKVLSKSNSNKLTFYLSYSGFLTQKIGINFIPVKGGEGSTEVWVLVVIQQTFKARFCVTDLCNECKRVKQWGEFFKQALYSSQCDHFTAASWPSYGSKQIDFIPTAQTRLCLYCNWQWLMIHRYRCLLCHLLKCSYGLLVMSNRMVYVG